MFANIIALIKVFLYSVKSFFFVNEKSNTTHFYRKFIAYYLFLFFTLWLVLNRLFTRLELNKAGLNNATQTNDLFNSLIGIALMSVITFVIINFLYAYLIDSVMVYIMKKKPNQNKLVLLISKLFVCFFLLLLAMSIIFDFAMYLFPNAILFSFYIFILSTILVSYLLFNFYRIFKLVYLLNNTGSILFSLFIGSFYISTLLMLLAGGKI